MQLNRNQTLSWKFRSNSPVSNLSSMSFVLLASLLPVCCVIGVYCSSSIQSSTKKFDLKIKAITEEDGDSMILATENAIMRLLTNGTTQTIASQLSSIVGLALFVNGSILVAQYSLSCVIKIDEQVEPSAMEYIGKCGSDSRTKHTGHRVSEVRLDRPVGILSGSHSNAVYFGSHTSLLMLNVSTELVYPLCDELKVHAHRIVPMLSDGSLIISVHGGLMRYKEKVTEQCEWLVGSELQNSQGLGTLNLDSPVGLLMLSQYTCVVADQYSSSKFLVDFKTGIIQRKEISCVNHDESLKPCSSAKPRELIRHGSKYYMSTDRLLIEIDITEAQADFSPGPCITEKNRCVEKLGLQTSSCSDASADLCLYGRFKNVCEDICALSVSEIQRFEASSPDICAMICRATDECVAILHQPQISACNLLKESKSGIYRWIESNAWVLQRGQL